jgi:predicted component of type VI protein secretion system
MKRGSFRLRLRGVMSRDDGKKSESGSDNRSQGVSEREIRAHVRRQLKRLLERDPKPKPGQDRE